MFTTALSEILGIEVPIVPAPFGSPVPGMKGQVEALALDARQGAGLVREILPAIVAQLAREAREALERSRSPFERGDRVLSRKGGCP